MKKQLWQTIFIEILSYNTLNLGVKEEVFLQTETLWFTQQKIAELYSAKRPATAKHLKNIFITGELKQAVVNFITDLPWMITD